MAESDRGVASHVHTGRARRGRLTGLVAGTIGTTAFAVTAAVGVIGDGPPRASAAPARTRFRFCAEVDAWLREAWRGCDGRVGGWFDGRPITLVSRVFGHQLGRPAVR